MQDFVHQPKQSGWTHWHPMDFNGSKYTLTSQTLLFLQVLVINPNMEFIGTLQKVGFGRLRYSYMYSLRVQWVQGVGSRFLLCVFSPGIFACSLAPSCHEVHAPWKSLNAQNCGPNLLSSQKCFQTRLSEELGTDTPLSKGFTLQGSFTTTVSRNPHSSLSVHAPATLGLGARRSACSFPSKLSRTVARPRLRWCL